MMDRMTRKSGEEVRTGDGNGTKMLLTGFAAVVGILAGMWAQTLRSPTDMVTERELAQRVLELQGKIDSMHAELIDKMGVQTGEIIALRGTTAQMSVDISGIAAKVGVPAHPIIVPQSLKKEDAWNLFRWVYDCSLQYSRWCFSCWPVLGFLAHRDSTLVGLGYFSLR
jgi:hypothetical protein